MSDEGCMPVAEIPLIGVYKTRHETRNGESWVIVELPGNNADMLGRYDEIVRMELEKCREKGTFPPNRLVVMIAQETDPLDELYPPSDEAPGIGDS